MRPLHANTKTELEKSGQYMIYLILLELDSGDQAFTTAHKDVVYGAHTYLASKKFIGFGNVTETQQLEISSMSFTFTAADQTLLSQALSEQIINREISLYRAMLDTTTYALISDPFLSYKGRIKSMTMTETPGGYSKLVFQTGSVLSDFQRTAGRRTNHNDQQAYMTIRSLSGTDDGFEFANQITYDIKWGRP